VLQIKVIHFHVNWHRRVSLLKHCSPLFSCGILNLSLVSCTVTASYHLFVDNKSQIDFISQTGTWFLSCLPADFLFYFKYFSPNIKCLINFWNIGLYSRYSHLWLTVIYFVDLYALTISHLNLKLLECKFYGVIFVNISLINLSEGRGSLLSFLKTRGWATSLSAGVGEEGIYRSSIAYVFVMSIHLTDSGIEKVISFC